MEIFWNESKRNKKIQMPLETSTCVEVEMIKFQSFHGIVTKIDDFWAGVYS
ncbi:hypothetical protein bsdE14_16740 [Clostridium omnivorum]|uniref:Uncharacterized protein n=1 Tax=Clostridium omnivorum TaxID=1604902 RepID=A0ABQ5N571_9CLOT|nr:hypothetical protein bsdE14_16740 [Clostridium sp. E14]